MAAPLGMGRSRLKMGIVDGKAVGTAVIAAALTYNTTKSFFFVVTPCCTANDAPAAFALQTGATLQHGDETSGQDRQKTCQEENSKSGQEENTTENAARS